MGKMQLHISVRTICQESVRVYASVGKFSERKIET